jgi:hypothetical protein
VRLTNHFFRLPALALLLVGPTVANAGPSGAIFTTNYNGTFVNGNVYDFQDDVYLNGGPQANKRCGAAGLPDGLYVFQVTDPSGKEVLSTDLPAERQVRVLGGVIIDDPVTAHQLLPGQCNGFTVQLAPYRTTPNPGGEYKVWMTPVDEYGNYEFTPSNSKTDNFKVVSPEPDIEPD